MRIFYDSEFTDFIATEPVSVGFVTEADDTFYAEVSDFNKALCSAFVREEVLPQLGKDPERVMPRHRLGLELARWLHRFDDRQVVIMFDYEADWDIFVDLMDGEVPPWIQGRNIRGHVDRDAASAFLRTAGLRAHHALHDALASRAGYMRSVSADTASLAKR